MASSFHLMFSSCDRFLNGLALLGIEGRRCDKPQDFLVGYFEKPIESRIMLLHADLTKIVAESASKPLLSHRPIKFEGSSAAPDFLVAALESGHSEVLTAYLGTMAKFHTYSFGNVMLIARQKPDATNVAGLRTWNSLGRFVKRGEKGIFILARIVWHPLAARSWVFIVRTGRSFAWEYCLATQPKLPTPNTEPKSD